MIIYMEKSRFENLDEEKIKEIIVKNLIKASGLKYKELRDYYIGKHKILEHTKSDASLPNNKIVNNISKYITDTATGYFLGNPVVYSSNNEKFMYEMQLIFDYNDEQDHNAELGKQMSIYGDVIEMIYLDEDANIRFTLLTPDRVLLIISSDLKETLGALRLIESKDDKGKTLYKIEFWDKFVVRYYKIQDEKELVFIQEVEHYFKDVPFVEYINNEERKGDFEGVISGIDAYNKAQSNTANLFEYNDDAILTVSKMGSVSTNDIKEMKEKRAVILEDGGKVDWLLKTIDDTALENYKKRLREDIHIFSSVPDMSDESFGGNLSGVAVSYKLWALDQITAIKERKFKKALQRRIEIITNILNIKGGNYNYMDITPSFRRNKPQNILEIAQVVTMLSGELSRETKLKMLPNIDDVKKEIEKLEEEKENTKNDFGITNNFIESIGKADEE